MRIPAGRLEIIDRVLIDGKKPQVAPYSGAMFAIVARSSTESEFEPVAEILDEFADNALLAQHLRNGEHKIRGGYALTQRPGKAEADHLRDQHRDGLAEHRRLSLDAADAPAQQPRAR